MDTNVSVHNREIQLSQPQMVILAEPDREIDFYSVISSKLTVFH